MSHMAQNIDIKCPSRGPRILISSHCDCPTVTKMRVTHNVLKRGVVYSWLLPAALEYPEDEGNQGRRVQGGDVPAC